METPLKQIALSTQRYSLGGGVARTIHTTISAINNWAHLDIFAASSLAVPDTLNTTVHITDPSSKNYEAYCSGKEYDLYIYLASRKPVYLGNILNSTQQLVCPNGNYIYDIEDRFDYVWCQSPDNYKYFDTKSKGILLPPAITLPVTHVCPIEGLPDNFYLTVFNPYKDIRNYPDGEKVSKGYDVIEEIADSLPHPLIWCSTLGEKNISSYLKNHPKIILVYGISQEKLYYLYLKCNTYVSFSREESFGWALADAIVYDKPIVSRNIGIRTYFSLQQEGMYLYSSTEELRQLIKQAEFSSVTYDCDIFYPEVFSKTLKNLVEGQNVNVDKAE